MWFFTADEHYGHTDIIKHCDRPFSNVEEMNTTIISNHNSVVGKGDITVHAGDFCWANKKKRAEQYIRRLNGSHIFIKGSHDSWLPSSAKCRWRKMLDGQFVTVDHYAGRTWERAHHGSWQLYGHWHYDGGNIGLQHNVCVDLNNFYPYSFEQIKQIMSERSSQSCCTKKNQRF